MTADDDYRDMMRVFTKEGRHAAALRMRQMVADARRRGLRAVPAASARSERLASVEEAARRIADAVLRGDSLLSDWDHV